jgi:hypothetical protein
VCLCVFFFFLFRKSLLDTDLFFIVFQVYMKRTFIKIYLAKIYFKNDERLNDHLRLMVQKIERYLSGHIIQ